MSDANSKEPLPIIVDQAEGTIRLPYSAERLDIVQAGLGAIGIATEVHYTGSPIEKDEELTVWQQLPLTPVTEEDLDTTAAQLKLIYPGPTANGTTVINALRRSYIKDLVTRDNNISASRLIELMLAKVLTEVKLIGPESERLLRATLARKALAYASEQQSSGGNLD